MATPHKVPIQKCCNREMTVRKRLRLKELTINVFYTNFCGALIVVAARKARRQLWRSRHNIMGEPGM